MLARVIAAYMLLAALSVSTINCTRFDSAIVYPPNAPRIFSHYGDIYSPGGRRDSPHEGVDIEGRLGNRWGGIGAPVLASAEGVVVFSGWRNAPGNLIVIDHGVDEDGTSLRTEYLHNSENLVRGGEGVKRGQQIAKVGHTGANRGRDPHLHFSVYKRGSKGWSHVDPHDYWYDGPYRITCFDPDRDYFRRPIKFTYPIECERENKSER